MDPDCSRRRQCDDQVDKDGGQSPARIAPETGTRFSVLHWRPGTSISAPPSASVEGERL